MTSDILETEQAPPEVQSRARQLSSDWENTLSPQTRTQLSQNDTRALTIAITRSLLDIDRAATHLDDWRQLINYPLSGHDVAALLRATSRAAAKDRTTRRTA